MSNSVKLAFSILDHLSRCLNEVSGDKAETLEVAIQCLEQVFDVENYDENQKQSLKVDKSLQEIFDAYHKEHTAEKKSSVVEPTDKDREQAEGHKKEGNDLMRMEKFQEAINRYTQAIALDNTNPVYPCNRAAAYSKLGEHQKAVDDCKQALKLDSKYSKAYGRMGLSYQNMNDLPKAQESYKKAIELEPDNAFYKNSLKVIEELLGQTRGPPPNTGPGLSSVGTMDFASLLSNPAIMNMAQNFMTSPQMQQMVSSMMTGGGPMGGGPMGGGPMGGSPTGGPTGGPMGVGPTGGGPMGGGGATGGGGGGGGGAGGMSQLFQAAQRFGEQLQESNPELMEQLRTQAQDTFHRNPSGNPFRDSNQPDDKGDDKKE